MSVEQHLANMRSAFGDHETWLTTYDKGEAWESSEIIQERIDNILHEHLGDTPANKSGWKNYVPRCLEIACGYGRATRILKHHCFQIYGIDINQNCIDFCKQEFPKDNFALTDGMSIPFDGVQFGLIYSHDSLVHSAAEVVENYVALCHQRLIPDGLGVFHHAATGCSTVGGRGTNSAQGVKDSVAFYGLTLVEQTFAYMLPSGEYNDCTTVFRKPRLQLPGVDATPA